MGSTACPELPPWRLKVLPIQVCACSVHIKGPCHSKMTAGSRHLACPTGRACGNNQLRTLGDLGAEGGTKNNCKLNPYSQILHALIRDLIPHPGFEGLFPRTNILYPNPYHRDHVHSCMHAPPETQTCVPMSSLPSHTSCPQSPQHGPS